MTEAFYAVFALGLAFGLASAAMAEARPLRIVATFSILADFVREIARDRATITTLVGPNGDTHLYRASPADARTVREADLIVVNGLGYDAFVPRLIRSSGTKARLVTAATGIDPINTADSAEPAGNRPAPGRSAQDPHAWQSIAAAKIYIANIRDGLAAADPAGAPDYRANADAYLAALDGLRRDIEAGFASIPPQKRVIVTSHDALGYFAREFGFRIDAVQGFSTDSDPSAKDVARLISALRARAARAIFIENMSNPKLAAQIARDSGARIGGTLYSDALSDETGPAATYIAMMRHNARLIAAALTD